MKQNNPNKPNNINKATRRDETTVIQNSSNEESQMALTMQQWRPEQRKDQVLTACVLRRPLLHNKC